MARRGRPRAVTRARSGRFPAVLHTLSTIVLFAAETAEEHEEPSKTPFYIAGIALALWAVVVSAIGLTRPDFPGSAAVSRAVYAISAVLVLSAMSMAIVTS